MKKQTVTPVPPTGTEHGSFSAGFMIGVLGGAVGMFLLGTKQGKEVLQHVRKEFEKTTGDTPPGEALSASIAPLMEKAQQFLQTHIPEEKSDETFTHQPRFRKKINNL